jgi:hypothetical protein
VDQRYLLPVLLKVLTSVKNYTEMPCSQRMEALQTLFTLIFRTHAKLSLTEQEHILTQIFKQEWFAALWKECVSTHPSHVNQSLT